MEKIGEWEIIAKFCRDIMLVNKQIDTHVKEFSINISSHHEKRNALKDGVEAADSNDIDSLNYEVMEVSREGYELTRAIEMQCNAFFLYSFTLFEKFLAEVVKKSVKKHKKVSDKYAIKFLEFAKDKARNGDERFLNMLTDRKKLIENYDELPNPLLVAAFVFDIKMDDPVFKKYFLRYIEARERRNLLTHRGEFLDERYLSTIKKNLGKFGQKAEKELANKILEKDALKRIKEGDKTVPASINPKYLNQITMMFLFLSNVIHMSGFRKTKKAYQNEGPHFSGVIHDIMIYAHDRKNPLLGFVTLEIWKYFKENIFCVPIEKWWLIDRVNYLLIKSFQYETFLSLAKSHEGEQDANELLRRFKKPDFKLLLDRPEEEFELQRQLAIAHFTEDVDGVIKAAEKLNLGIREYKEWFLFRFWKNNAQIANFFEKNK